MTVQIQFNIENIRPLQYKQAIMKISIIDPEFYMIEYPYEFFQSTDIFLQQEIRLPSVYATQNALLRIQLGYIINSEKSIENLQQFVTNFNNLSNEQTIISNTGRTANLVVLKNKEDKGIQFIVIQPIMHNFDMKVETRGSFINYIDYLGIEIETPYFKIIYRYGRYNYFIENCNEFLLKLVFFPLQKKIYESLAFYNIHVESQSNVNSLVQLEINIPHTENYFITHLNELLLYFEDNENNPEVQNSIEIYFFNELMQEQLECIDGKSKEYNGVNFANYNISNFAEQQMDDKINAILAEMDTHVRSPSFPKGIFWFNVRNQVVLEQNSREFANYEEFEQGKTNWLYFWPEEREIDYDFVICCEPAFCFNKHTLEEFNLQLLEVPKESFEQNNSQHVQQFDQKFQQIVLLGSDEEYRLAFCQNIDQIDELTENYFTYLQDCKQALLEPALQQKLLLIKIVKGQLFVIDEISVDLSSQSTFLISALSKPIHEQFLSKLKRNFSIGIRWKNEYLLGVHKQFEARKQ